MSEQTTEAPTTEPEPATEPEPEAPASPQGPEETTPDAEPPEPLEGPDEGASEPQEPSEDDQAPTSAQDERAIEARYKKLGNENERHAKRVGEIMEDDATSLIPCPVCMDGIAGWIYPPEAAPLAPEAVARIRQVIGLPDYTTFRAAKDATTCPDCGGLGEVTTGSHVPGYETKTCGLCGKKGWIGVGAVATNGHVEQATGEIVTGPTVYGAETEDPEILHLRQRGFTVIPPMTVQSGV